MQDERYRLRIAAQSRYDKADLQVKTLENDLARVEKNYYDENDLNYRDTVLQERFAQTKRQLEDARRELADARDALTALNKS